METTPTPATPHYKRPDWFTRNVFNPTDQAASPASASASWGSRVLEHRGRTSGKLHHTPVNLLTYEGQQYLVAPRGDTQWVRNVRSADGHLVLILGRRRELCTATEIPVENSVPDPALLPEALEVRDRHVLRRRHAPTRATPTGRPRRPVTRSSLCELSPSGQAGQHGGMASRPPRKSSSARRT